MPYPRITIMEQQIEKIMFEGGYVERKMLLQLCNDTLEKGPLDMVTDIVVNEFSRHIERLKEKAK